jgi:hypothetical protein
MGLIKGIFEIFAPVASEFFGKWLIALGIVGFIFGGFISAILLSVVLSLIGVEQSTTNILIVVVAIIICLVSIGSVILGFLMLKWEKKK